ncbi:MAG: methyl-accepting chemotaxis protein [Phycisphaeraceae bacterium]|nr:MAG: methyl-accepting chemotaxis protein [Phycisphaeraceae bacterium]
MPLHCICPTAHGTGDLGDGTSDARTTEMKGLKMKLTIAKKLALGFGALVLMLIVVGVVSIRGGRVATYGVQEIDVIVDDLVLGAEALEALLTMRMRVQNFLVDNDEESIAGFNEARAIFLKDLEECEASFTNPERVAALQGIREGFTAYDNAFNLLQDAVYGRQSTILNRLNPIAEEMREHVDGMVQDAFAAGEIELAEQAAYSLRDLLLARDYVMRYINLNTDENYQRAREEIANTIQGLREARANATGTGVNGFGRAIELIEDYNNALDEMSGFVNQRNNLVENQIDVYGPRIADYNREIQESLAQEAHDDVDMVAAAVAGAQMMIIFITLFAIVFGVATAIMIARGVIKPIQAITERLQDIAEGEGDLTQRVDEDRPDELGVLGKWFNVFVARIQDLIREVAGSANEVASAATQIAASSEQISSGMQQQQSQTAQVASAVEEMAASVTEVAQKATEASQKSDEAGKLATDGGDVVRQTVEGMQSISEQVNESAVAVGELGKRGEQIGEIIGVINDIADQTNLLALNAAIEAARAGEHGRGFAVVADEVRKLAERTQKATEEVADSIKAIQTDTTRAVERMQTGRERVGEGVTLAEQAGESLRSIVAGSREVAAMIQSIAAGAEEQSAASTQVSRSVESINAVTSESAEGVRQASAAATQLSAKAEQLQTLVGKFKLE